jgi:hypothetical protein
MAEALEIVTGRLQTPSELQQATSAFLSSLSFAETAALHESAPAGEADALCSIVASRWRLMSALSLRPSGEFTPDAEALEQLLQEVDGTLAALAGLKGSEDPDVQEASEAARKALAKDVHRLLPTTSGPGPGGDAAGADLKQLRSALAAAARAEQKSGKGLRSVPRTKKAMVVFALGLLSIASAGFSAFRVLREDRLPEVPVLPQIPPNTQMMGDPKSGTVILRSTNGQPIDRQALEKFKGSVDGNGATVQLLGPTQALVTTAKRR